MRLGVGALLSLAGAVLATIVASLAVFAIYALSSNDPLRSFSGLALFGVAGIGLGLLVGRRVAVVAPVAFYAGMLFWPSVIHLLCALEGCGGAAPLDWYVSMLGYFFPLAAYGTLMGVLGAVIRRRPWRRATRQASPT